MNKYELTNKLDELHNYLDELEELIESDKETIMFFCSDIAKDGYNISTHALPRNKKLIDKGLIVEYEDQYFKPWQLEIYCQDYPNSQQFDSDCEEFGYNNKEKQEYEDEHHEKIKECSDAEDRISIEIDRTKEEIKLLTDKLELEKEKEILVRRAASSVYRFGHKFFLLKRQIKYRIEKINEQNKIINFEKNIYIDVLHELSEKCNLPHKKYKDIASKIEEEQMETCENKCFNKYVQKDDINKFNDIDKEFTKIWNKYVHFFNKLIDEQDHEI